MYFDHIQIILQLIRRTAEQGTFISCSLKEVDKNRKLKVFFLQAEWMFINIWCFQFDKILPVA